MTNNDLGSRVAVMEERMNTVRAELRADMAEHARDIANRSAAAADFRTRLIFWQIGFAVALAGLAASLVLHFVPAAKG